MKRILFPIVVSLAAITSPVVANADANDSPLGCLEKETTIASTVPRNGDLNPYGVAIAPVTKGRLVRGHVLVSNFNNSQNQQGTGRTIVQIAPNGRRSLFAYIDPDDVEGRCPGGVGLTTALVALESGVVVVGSLPTSDGTSATAQAGCLIVLNSHGRVLKTLVGGEINGPWDMTALDLGRWAVLFVTNVLNGTVQAGGDVVNQGTVVRIVLAIPDEDERPPFELRRTVIGSDFPEKTDPAALVIGPTGVGLGHGGTLFVADTVSNRIAAISDALFRQSSAGIGRTVSQGDALNSPLGLTITPDGNILTANGGDGNLVETTPRGQQVAIRTVDTTGSPPGAGTLFGLAIAPHHRGVYFVDDGDNTLRLLK